MFRVNFSSRCHFIRVLRFKDMVSRYFVFLAILVGLTSAVKLDLCRTKPPVMKDFKLLKLEGRWYEYARYPNLFQYFNKEKCNALDMEVDGKGIHFKTSFINETSGDTVTYEGNMTANDQKPGKVFVALPQLGLSDYYSILAAKYDDYVVFYFCDTLWYFRVELTWVLTRKPTLSEEKKEQLLQKLKTLKIETERLEYENQTDC